MSRKRVDNLGQQLAAEGAVGDENRGLFSQILEHYQQLLDDVAYEISRIGYKPTTRVKTTGTLIEKLRREHGIQLSRIQDVAGARIVVGRLRTEQDQARDEICEIFEGFPRLPVVIDRRVDPKHGYRAVHVIVYPEGIPVEVQIRTTLQDVWAQVFEGLADQWGRQIRYGGAPEFPESIVAVGDANGRGKVTRADILKRVQLLGGDIDLYEKINETMVVLLNESPLAQPVKILARMLEETGSTSEDLVEYKDYYARLRRFCIERLLINESDKRRQRRLIRRSFPRRAQPTLLDFERVIDYVSSSFKSLVIDVQSQATRHEDVIKGRLSELARTIGGVV